MTEPLQPPAFAVEDALPEVHEPLADSAMLAMAWSETHCGNCRPYHGAWQVLRLLGVMNSMRSDDDFLVPQLARLIDSGAERILISGAADYALLARVAAVAGARAKSLKITVADRCGTPLELNRWYAERAGLDVETWCGDVLEYRNPGAFDLVCTHSFFCFFDSAGREALTSAWWNCLAPDGAVLTAQRTRPDDPHRKHGFSQSQAESLAERARRLAEGQFDRLRIDPGLAESLANAYASSMNTFTIREHRELREIFLKAGFRLEHFAPPGGEQFEEDIPSVPSETGSFRWRILARKPRA